MWGAAGVRARSVREYRAPTGKMLIALSEVYEGDQHLVQHVGDAHRRS